MILRDFFSEAANPAQQAAIAIAMKKAGKKPKTEAANPADTLYFFDVAQGGRSFNHLDLKIMGLRQTKSGKWYYQPGRDSTDLLTNASLKHLEKTLNVPARAWKRPVTENPRIARKPGQPADSKKHSDLYTDENPRGTITGLKFATVEDARASVSKIRSSGRSHAHKIQAAVAMEQRARAAGKTEAAAVYRKYINATKKTDEGVDLEEACWDTHRQVGMKKKGGKMVPNCVPRESMEESNQSCPQCGGPAFSDLLLAEKQDACYHKVKSRYKVWPSAYASGALVQCRKKGADNWGNKSR